MVNKRQIFAFFLLFLSASAFLQALDVTRGKIKLTVYEKTGRFTLAYAEELADPFYIPLFVSEDPTTSRVSVSLDDKTFILGDDLDFKSAIESTPSGIRITWVGPRAKIIQSFDFISSSQSPVVDGLQISFSIISQKAEAPLRAGLRFLLDTNLGEKKDHFVLSNSEKVDAELLLEQSRMPEAFMSPSSKEGSGLGLLVMLGGGATQPSRLVFANWRRLKEANWEIPYRQGRDFNLMPYSFNDSAAALYYDPINIESGQNREIVLLMGSRSATTFAGSKLGTANVLSDILDGTRNLSNQDLKESIKKDREVVEDLLKKIENALQNASSLSEDDIKILQAIFAELDQRKKIYQ